MNSVSEPEIIGYYSVDGDKKYLPDCSALSYYNPPKLGKVYMNLNEGMESRIKDPKRIAGGRTRHLLEWIEANSVKILASKADKWIEPEFVCTSGLLSLMMCTPFAPKDSWIICAAKWRGTIYLCRFNTQEQVDWRANEPQKFSAWGFKFEQYIVSDHPDKSPNTSRPVVETAEFRCVLKRRFGAHAVLFCAEKDAIVSKTVLKDPLNLNNLKFVELKTKKMIEHEGQRRNFRKFNLVKWWTQSYVAGTDNILCGFRDDDGIVRELTSYSLDEIVEMCESYWDPDTCINYGKNFLSLVAKTVVEQCDKTVYKFEKMPYRDIVTTKVSPTSEYAFLPASFLEKTG